MKRVTSGPGLAGIIKNVKDAKIKVGILSGTGAHPNGNGQTIAEVAFWNEFGTVRIPARPFLRTTLKQNKSAYKSDFKNALKAVLSGRTSSPNALGRIGAKVAADVQRTITALSSPPNTDLTILLKNGKQNPLIDSGIMRSSITWGPV